MRNTGRKYRRIAGFLVFLALLFFDNTVLSQKQTRTDTLNFRPNIISHLKAGHVLFPDDSLSPDPGKLIPYGFIGKDRTLIFFDSLKVKASKKLITRQLYNLLIIPSRAADSKYITNPSDLDYKLYSGKTIRNIEVQQLRVFGSNINDPRASDPDRADNLLNRTHINTSEFIIRKNLLFSEGDIVSPLVLSDNERLIRELPYIDDARILIAPVSDKEVDIIVLTRDVYSLGADISFSGIKKGKISLFEKNIFGLGHEIGLEIPYDPDLPHSPGVGIRYKADNLIKTFINLNLFYFSGLGRRTYGFDLSRKLVSSTTKYAGGISVRQMFTSEDLDTLPEPEPLKYNLQDYWISRSFLVNSEKVARIIIGARYTNNNVFVHPFILPDSYHYLQTYKMFLGSAGFSVQKFYKTNLVYGYGRIEDIPHGGLVNATIGNEISEFKKRMYASINMSYGGSAGRIGYFYSSAGFGTFLNDGRTEQGMLSVRTSLISNLIYIRRYRMRNFVTIGYTRGFGRYSDEHLIFNPENGFSGFRNDSIGDNQRITLSLESVLFSPINFYGFRCTFFGFADLGLMFGSYEYPGSADVLSGVGLGIRIRNDHLVFKTFQVRLGFFPNLPSYSSIHNLVVSGEALLKPYNFEPGPPSILLYK